MPYKPVSRFLAALPDDTPPDSITSVTRKVHESTAATCNRCGPLYIEPSQHASMNRRCVVTVVTMTETTYLTNDD